MPFLPSRGVHLRPRSSGHGGHGGHGKALCIAAVTATALLATGSPPLGAETPAAAATQTDAQPNVVVILVDDATVDDVMDPRVMPNVARWLTEAGVSFSTSYAPFPLCCPARATLLTGQYAHNHGVLDNH